MPHLGEHRLVEALLGVALEDQHDPRREAAVALREAAVARRARLGPPGVERRSRDCRGDLREGRGVSD